MKILHLCDSIVMGGGISSFLSNLVGVQADSHDVEIVTTYSLPKEGVVFFRNNVSLKSFGKRIDESPIKYILLAYNYIKKSDCSIVHIHSDFLYYALAVILLHRVKKFVYTIHSDAVRENYSKYDKAFLWLKRLCFRLQWIHPITISKESKRSFDTLYGMDSRLIVNGIKKPEHIVNRHKLDKYRYTSQTKLFYHPGRITEAKNQVVLCESFHRLIMAGADVVLLISGTKQDKNIYAQLENYFSDRIIYLGERNDVLELLSECDAMCLPSIWEGMPIVLLEALSVGCIPICTSVGGIPEAVTDGYNGILSTSTNAEDYLKAIHRFLSMSKEEVDVMRQRTLASFDNFNIEKTAAEYENFYTSLLEN